MVINFNEHSIIKSEILCHLDDNNNGFEYHHLYFDETGKGLAFIYYEKHKNKYIYNDYTDNVVEVDSFHDALDLLKNKNELRINDNRYLYSLKKKKIKALWNSIPFSTVPAFGLKTENRTDIADLFISQSNNKLCVYVDNISLERLDKNIYFTIHSEDQDISEILNKANEQLKSYFNIENV